jgi:L-lactate permease
VKGRLLLTESEIASNVLFGSLQPISSERLGFNPASERPTARAT